VYELMQNVKKKREIEGTTSQTFNAMMNQLETGDNKTSLDSIVNGSETEHQTRQRWASRPKGEHNVQMAKTL